MDDKMTGYVKKTHYLLFILLLPILSCSSLYSIMGSDGDAVAKPMIDKIEKYKKNNGRYPESLMKLIPDYLPHYDFQAFIYEHNEAQGKNENYTLKVRFQRYTAECTFINGQRKSCRYIGNH